MNDYVSVYEFDYSQLRKYKPIRRGKGRPKKHEKRYLDCITRFDIETSTVPGMDQAFMYIWQFQIEDLPTVIGRTWDEYFYFLDHIRMEIGNYWFVRYIHNASFEFSFVKGVYDFEPNEVFRTEPRKVLKFTMFDQIEYRCSYYLTNLSLDKFLKQMNVENKKLSGDEFDYSKVRYPWTELTDREIQYCINDVRGLVQALKKFMAVDNDNLATIPMTSTGFVRRDVRKAMERFNYDQLHDMLPDVRVYTVLNERFRGGDTHSNRWLSNIIVENVSSVDRVSSYPDVMMNCKFPMSKFWPIPGCTPEKVRAMMKTGRYALLMRIAFYDIELSDPFDGAPYLSRDKCRKISDPVYDNGRIISRSYLETSITDIDLKIILQHYRFSASNPFEVYYRKYKPLPTMLTDVVMKYYRIKTELKHIGPDDERYTFYLANKARLNRCYGMTAQNPVKDSIDYINGEFVVRDEPIEKLLDQSNRKAFLNYRWGVWVTAWARLRLHEMIWLRGHDFVYCDTDSVKYVGKINMKSYNRQRIKDSKRTGAFATDNAGTVHYMGVFENEGYELPNRFKTMGAKKYVLEDNTGKLHITIAGVNKKKGGEELGRLENFKEGFIFSKAGGTESVFNDNVNMDIMADGRHLTITDNVVIKDSTYTLGLTADYLRILNGCHEIAYSDNEIYGLYHKKQTSKERNI